MKLFQFWLMVTGLTLNQFNFANAQDINFDDLKRQGRPLSKTVTITGLADEAKSNLSRFDEIDSSRVAQREVDMRASAERYQTQGKAGQGQFTCTFRCQAGNGEIRGPYSQRFGGATRNQAENEIKKSADELCRRMRGDGAIFKNVTMSTRDEKCE